MSRAGQLFAVSADTAYEGREVVAVFDTQNSAETFAKKCREHDGRMPQPPAEILDTSENDAAFTAWDAKCERWRARHPAKMHSTHDSWSVFPIRYCKD